MVAQQLAGLVCQPDRLLPSIIPPTPIDLQQIEAMQAVDQLAAGPITPRPFSRKVMTNSEIDELACCAAMSRAGARPTCRSAGGGLELMFMMSRHCFNCCSATTGHRPPAPL
jgi:hypothetical protein